MPLGDTFANDLAKLILQAIAIADLAEDDTTSPLTDLYISLHTADPGGAGSQTTNECTYTDYARVAVNRDNTGFTVTGRQVVPAADIDFPVCSGGTETATHLMIGTAPSGAGKQLMRGTITPNIAISTGVTPRLTTATVINFI